jgi:predicted metal-dependent enzyme (double-stranded beta helix superfamily)
MESRVLQSLATVEPRPKEASMAPGNSDWTRSVRDLQAITTAAPSPGAIIAGLRPKVRELALSRDWVQPDHYACDPGQGFGVHALHEEVDHTLWVVVFSWLPGRGAPPHDHRTWAVVAGVEGLEKNTYWRRLDDGRRPGHAEVAPVGEEDVVPGDVVAFLPDAIHSVTNATDRVTLSLHVYGRNLNRVGRSQFDPEKQTESPFVVTVR